MLAGGLRSQTIEVLKEEISYHADVLLHAQEAKHRVRAGEALDSLMESFISMPGSYATTLSDIPWISVIQEDAFRVVTWQLKVSEEDYRYTGFIQWPDHVVQLKDTRPFVNGFTVSQSDASTWYGCLYYKSIPFENKGKKYYVLLGFHAQNGLLNTKLADVLDVNGVEPKFGLPVFVNGDDKRTRLFMNYADVSNFRMSYDTLLGGIVHDHLESLPGVGPGGEALPVSDGSLEAWILKKGFWVYEEEVYDVKMKEPPMTEERKERKEDKDILGRPKKE